MSNNLGTIKTGIEIGYNDVRAKYTKYIIRDDNRIENLQLVSDDRHKQLTILETKIDRLTKKQDELMVEIRLLRFGNKQLRAQPIVE